MSDPDSPVNPPDDTPAGGGGQAPDPGEPTRPMPTQPGAGDETPPQGFVPPGETGAPPVSEPTTVMPAQPVAAGAAGAAAGAGQPPAMEYRLDDEEVVPWYRRPAYLIMVLVAVLLAALLLAWLLFWGDDDDDPDPDEVSLRIELVDDQDNPVDRSLTATVIGSPGAEQSFVWLQPTSEGATATGNTGSAGQIDFRWQPDDTVADPANWASIVAVTEELPPGWNVPGPSIDCDLERAEGGDITVTMNVAIDPDDVSLDREAVYSFPNQTFLPGDAISCRLISTAPVETTTTVEESTTTVEETTTTAETTTTVAPTTAAPTTAAPTTAAPTTAAPTTAAPTTTDAPTTTVAPDTVLTVIQTDPDLSELSNLITLAGLEATLSDPSATLTFFAPDNDAIAAARAGGDPLTDSAAVRSLLLAHLHQGDAWTVADLDQRTDVPVVNGQPQPLDTSQSPPLVGSVDAQIVDGDNGESNGVVQIIDLMLTIQ